MNERIKELADQCWNNFYIGDYEVKAPHAFARRFAKMIINECINVIRDKVSTDVVDQIKHHFGIQ